MAVERYLYSVSKGTDLLCFPRVLVWMSLDILSQQSLVVYIWVQNTHYIGKLRKQEESLRNARCRLLQYQLDISIETSGLVLKSTFWLAQVCSLCHEPSSLSPEWYQDLLDAGLADLCFESIWMKWYAGMSCAMAFVWNSRTVTIYSSLQVLRELRKDELDQ